MGYPFGNNWSDGYAAKSYVYKPAWERDIDYSPDHQRSSSAMFVEERGQDIVCVLQVRGLGAIVMRAQTDWRSTDGQLDFKGVSTFTKDEIGFTPNL